MSIRSAYDQHSIGHLGGVLFLYKKSQIFKDTRSNADKRAKEAFAKGVDRVRKETNDSYKGLIVVLNFADPVAEIDRATL